MVTLVERVDALVGTLEDAARRGARVGLVPTMGALHDGHRALIEAARERDDVVCVSIFVNPLQFDDPNDLAAYPRSLAHDVEVAAAAGADIVFAPSPSELHPEPVLVRVSVAQITDPMEGASRPGHFEGVATVVTKLLALVRPQHAYFGEKDYQQLLVVRRLVIELHLRCEVVAVETVRDPWGLALSSRNQRLSASGLSEARRVAGVLGEYAARARVGDRAGALVEAVRGALAGTELDYVVVADPPLLTVPATLSRGSRLFCAWRVEGVRLIDNRPLGSRDGA